MSLLAAALKSSLAKEMTLPSHRGSCKALYPSSPEYVSLLHYGGFYIPASQRRFRNPQIRRTYD